MVRQRMTGKQRREQLISIGRSAFAEQGFDGTSVEDIAARASVSKPVVYEHFGGKEGLYAVVVDREMQDLERRITESIATGSWRDRIEQAAMALLTYVEEETDGFMILVRDPSSKQDRAFSTLLNTAVSQVSHILGTAFNHRGFDDELAVLYAQALVGMVSMTAQWWLDERQPAKELVAAHVVNLCWNGLSDLETSPKLGSQQNPTPEAPAHMVETGSGVSTSAISQTAENNEENTEE